MLVKAELKKASNTEILALKGVDISTPNMTLFFFICGVCEKPDAYGHNNSRVCCYINSEQELNPLVILFNVFSLWRECES